MAELRDGSKHMLARRLLCARAQVLEYEHMLGLLVLGPDGRSVTRRASRITKWYKIGKKPAQKAEKSSNFTVNMNSIKKKLREEVKQQNYK